MAVLASPVSGVLGRYLYDAESWREVPAKPVKQTGAPAGRFFG
jgi:hypothetical protein